MVLAQDMGLPSESGPHRNGHSCGGEGVSGPRQAALTMTEPQHRRLVVWEARHDNGWITIVMEQPDGTFVAWAGLGETVGVDYVEDTPEHAQAAAMFALKRKCGHAQCSIRCSAFEMRPHAMLVAPPH
jgi:hypothetical protein